MYCILPLLWVAYMSSYDDLWYPYCFNYYIQVKRKDPSGEDPPEDKKSRPSSSPGHTLSEEVGQFSGVSLQSFTCLYHTVSLQATIQ